MNKQEKRLLRNDGDRMKNYKIDMCNGPIIKKMLLFALPLMCSSILQLLFNAADIIVVGRFAGDNSLAAVGATGPLINLLVNLFVGLSIGANVVAAKDFGAKREDELSKTVHTAMLLSLFSGILLTVVGFFASKQILQLMNIPDNVLGLSTTYMRIYFLGMTANMIYNFGSAILRAVGDTRRPLNYLLLAGIVNVILNLIFVIVFKLGVAGVAIATAISQFISAALVVRCLMHEQGGLQLVLSKLHIYKDKFKRILQIGIPAGLQGILFSLSNVVIQRSINSFQEVVMAGNSAAGNIEGFIYVAMNAFYQATLSFTSQNIGAKKYGRIKKILFCGEACVIVVGTTLGILAIIFGDTLLGIYSTSKEVIKAGMVRFNVICYTYALCGMMDVIVGSLRGLGYSIMPMIVTLLGACGLRLLWIATVFQIPQLHKVTTIYFSYPISWAITFLVHFCC